MDGDARGAGGRVDPLHLTRKLLAILRDGHRRPRLCHGQRRREARQLCRLWDVRPRLSRGVLKLEVKPDRFKGGTPILVYSVDL